MAFKLDDRILHIGEVIKAGADIATDEEGKASWASGKVKIKVLDENTLGVSWGVRKVSITGLAGKGPETSGILELIRMKWTDEVEQEFLEAGKVDLSDVYHKGPFFRSNKALVHF